MSDPVRVTLFEDRAEVVRRAKVTVKPGLSWVSLTGFGPYLDDRSLQARVPGGEATVTAARVRRRVHHEQAAGRAEIAALEAAYTSAEQRTAAAEAELERAHAAAGAAEQLLTQWTRALAGVPRFLGEPERAGEWRAAYAALDTASSEAHLRRAAARAALTEAAEARERAELRLAEGLTLSPQRETLVEVQLDVKGTAVEAVVEVTYRTPCALWRPEHLARLVVVDGAARIELTTWATAWQRTGERWDDVEVAFSTARTAQAASPPLMGQDVLRQQKKSDEDKKRVVVEARDQSVAVAGLDRGVRAVDEMPGVDDGGAPLSFSPPGRVALVSDGRPFRVEIARSTIPATTALVLYPERALAAHLRATATLARPEPLLAGPVRVARGPSLVGRAKLDFVGSGEPFELGFGVDDGVRVRRTVDEKRDTTAIVGTQKVWRTVKIYLSNLSGDARQVELCERVPVSEIEDVVVTVDESAWRLDSKDGFARQAIALPARSTRTVELKYEIKAASKVVLPF